MLYFFTVTGIVPLASSWDRATFYVCASAGFGRPSSNVGDPGPLVGTEGSRKVRRIGGGQLFTEGKADLSPTCGADITSRIVKSLYSPDRARRVVVIERADGRYGLRVEKRFQNVYEGRLVAEGWRRLHDAPSVFETADLAEHEARSRFPWLAPESQPVTTAISTNDELFAALQCLVEAWCDRRCLRALRHILSGYPLPSPFTDGWGALYEALRHVRASDRDELTEAEAETVDNLIVAVGQQLYRR